MHLAFESKVKISNRTFAQERIMVDFTLTEEQKKWQMRARKFAQDELLPVAHYFDEADEMPAYILERAYDAGLMNLGIPIKG